MTIFYRCSDGHLYSAAPVKATVMSLHLGSRHLQRCPVDRRWHTAARVPAEDLSDSERTEALAHRF